MSKRRAKGTGCLTQKKNGTWEYRVYLGVGTNGKPMYKSFYSKSKKEVINKHKEWLKNGEIAVEKVQTVEQWAKQWLLIYKKDKVQFSTYSNYELYVNKHVVPEIGNLKIENVRPADIEKLFKHKTQLSLSSQRHLRLTLKQIFETAINNRLCTSNPVGRLNTPREEEKKPQVFSSDNLKKMITAIPTHCYGHYIGLLIYTGLRMSELLALQWGDIDFKNEIITVRHSFTRKEGGGYTMKSTKSGKERYIGITKELETILLSIPKTSLFVINDNGDYLTPHQFEKRYKHFFEDNNIEYLSPHKCRHTFATNLLEQGANIRAVQDLLGHSTIVMTEKYTHTNIEQIKKATAKLSYN